MAVSAMFGRHEPLSAADSRPSSDGAALPQSPELFASLPLAQFAPRSSAVELPGQFVLSRTGESMQPGWMLRSLHGWVLASHPFLHVTTLRALDGADVGWLLGDPIGESAAFLPDVVPLPFDRYASPSEMEAWLARLCGRFLVIWLTPIYERVYPDAGALLGAVFAPELGLVASTPSLVPYGRGCDEDPGLAFNSKHPDGRAVMAFGLTPRQGVERLLPNHHLDLNRWTAQRHWPAAPLDAACDPADAVQVVARIIRRHVSAGLRRGDVLMALTAGIDSRAILACAREFMDRVELMTIAIPDNTGRLDVDVAKRIARRHRLRHRVLEHLAPTAEDLDGWLWRTGAAVSEPRGWRASRSHSQAGFASEITGSGGEAARAGFWRDAGGGKHAITAGVLVDCAKLPRTEPILERARAWMSEYPATTPVQLLDGFFIENSLGVTAAALAYGDAGFVRCRLYPYVNHEAIHAMLRLPESYKLARRFQTDLIRYAWPELLRVPINRRAGVRNVVDNVRRRAWFARRALAGSLLAR